MMVCVGVVLDLDLEKLLYNFKIPPPKPVKKGVMANSIPEDLKDKLWCIKCGTSKIRLISPIEYGRDGLCWSCTDGTD